MDDVIVFGRTIEEHDKRLKLVLKQIEEARATVHLTKTNAHLDSPKSSFWGT